MPLSEQFSRGFRGANRSWNILLVLYGANVVLAAVLASGLSSALQAGLGNSMMPQRLLEGFDANTYNDFLRVHKNFLTPLVGQFGWLVVFWMLLNTLFGGGILAALRRETGVSLAEFFADCGTYMVRFLLLLLLGAIGVAVVGALWMIAAGILFNLMTSGATAETTYVTGFVITAVVYLIPIILALMIVDYARVIIVVEDTQPLDALGRSIRFVFRNLPATFGWQLSMIILALVLIAAYWFMADELQVSTGALIVLAFVIQQVSIGSRLWARFVTLGGQIALFESRTMALGASTMTFVSPTASPLPPMPVAAVKPVKKTSPARARKAQKKKTTRKK